jgi:hypothetical protein
LLGAIRRPQVKFRVTSWRNLSGVSGNGLTGAHFPRKDLTGTPVTRIDAVKK